MKYNDSSQHTLRKVSLVNHIVNIVVLVRTRLKNHRTYWVEGTLKSHLVQLTL